MSDTKQSNPAEQYIRDVILPSGCSDDEKTLIAGNIRNFYATLKG